MTRLKYKDLKDQNGGLVKVNRTIDAVYKPIVGRGNGMLCYNMITFFVTQFNAMQLNAT